MPSARISALRRPLPIRWKLAGGSALLTLTILLTFALLVGVLSTRDVRSSFHDRVRRAADDLGSSLQVRIDSRTGRAQCRGVSVADYSRAEEAKVRVLLADGALVCGAKHPAFGPPHERPVEVGGYRVEARAIPVFVDGERRDEAVVEFARPLSDLQETVDHVRLLLVLGVLGGAALALLAGLAVARRAMRPIADLTSTAREIERTGDPARRLPVPQAADEVSELARTLDGMLRSLDAARTETEQALERQRAFVADASHELRTPLTSVLANLELLAAELEGEERDTADSALRSTHRMRRLVADLLLLARADAGRTAPRSTVDLAEIMIEAARELEPVADRHALSVDAAEPVWVEGIPDELHRLTLNLLQNALTHTPPGTRVRAETRRADDGRALLAVEDDGPGVPPPLARRIFDRFVRASGDTGGGTGLGLAIVRAVTESHGGEVRLESGAGGRGARFEVRLPVAPARVEIPA